MPVRTIDAGFPAGSSANGRIGVFPRPSASPEIAFDTGAIERSTHVKLNEFDGPLALLLALIEARQLDILTVPLGSLAEAYLDALATLEGDKLGNVAAFVAVSAQLILIKSRAILPRAPKLAATALDDEPDPEAELRARLLEYKRFRDAAMGLGARLDAAGLFRRDADIAVQAGRAGAIPPERPPLPPIALSTALRRLAKAVVDVPMAQGMVARTVTITERTAVIRDALRGSDVVVLQELLRGVRDRVVVAITFLAMLELSKRREIVIEQAEPWGPIIARRVVPEDGSAPMVEDEEIDESLGSFA
jgi:segregation and condensation protein A